MSSHCIIICKSLSLLFSIMKRSFCHALDDSASINAPCHGILWVINLKEAISMRATGIVRRIDELGRVVIPKEIRRTLRIREGDPLEIYTDRDGEVILKK